MVDTRIKAGIAYSFCAVPYSLLGIRKLGKYIIVITKIICGLPKCTPNIVTQLPHYMFGIQACSLHNAYLRCIGLELRNVRNDKGGLQIIYTGLTYFILAKHGGAANVPTIKHQHCIYSPPLEHPSYFQLHGVKFFISTTALTPEGPLLVSQFRVVSVLFTFQSFFRLCSGLRCHVLMSVCYLLSTLKSSLYISNSKVGSGKNNIEAATNNFTAYFFFQFNYIFLLYPGSVQSMSSNLSH